MNVKVKSLSCVRLFCDSVDCSPQGFSVHGISQARILEWVAIFFSRGSSLPRDQTHISCMVRQILHQGSPPQRSSVQFSSVAQSVSDSATL